MYAPFATSNTVDFQPYNCHYNCHPNERCEITLRPTLPPNLIRKAANISPKLSVKFMFSSHRQEKLPIIGTSHAGKMVISSFQVDSQPVT